MKNTIGYWIFDNSRLRVFKTLAPIEETNQVILALHSVKANDCQLKKVYYRDNAHFKDLLRKLEPKVIVCSSNSAKWVSKLKKREIKLVYIKHGIWDRANNLNYIGPEYWQKFDLLIGGTNSFRHIMRHNYGVTAPIVTNALPQFDILYEVANSKQYYRDELCKRFDFNPERIIVLFGHALGKGLFKSYDRCLFETAFRLREIAEKNNWLIVIKPKRDNFSSSVRNRVDAGEWPLTYLDELNKLRDSPNVGFIPFKEDPYKLFCADAIICSGHSTIEVEACMANIPVAAIKVREGYSVNHDPLGAHLYGCSQIIYEDDDVEKKIFEMIAIQDMPARRAAYMKFLGLSFDGKATERAQNSIIQLI